MPNLALSSELFAGALINLALYITGTSDETTKPISSSALWLELARCSSLKPKATKVSEDVDVVTATGWAVRKREYTVADMFEVVTEMTTGLYQQLQFGLAASITAGTAQTPFITADRMVKAWMKVQLRQHTGTDRYVLDCLTEIRVLGDPPAAEKKTQQPNLEFYVIPSTLNAFNLPA